MLLYCHNVGEIRSAIPLVNALRAGRPEWRISFLTKAVAAYGLALKSFGDFADVFFAPLDSPMFARRSLGRIDPDLLAIIEGDLRTHLIAAAKTGGAAVVLLGGEMSPGEVRKHRARRVFRHLLAHVDALAVRSARDSEKLTAAGAPPDRLFISGNLRFDVSTLMTELADTALSRVLSAWRENGPLLVAGSTYREEESELIDALRIVRGRFPGTRLIIAPRQPGRAAQVEAAAEAGGFRTVRRTDEGLEKASGADVMILDSMGELSAVYGFGHVAFVGGSMVGRGGHNVIEAAAHGIPVLFGPSVYTNQEVCDELLRNGAGWTVGSAGELAARVSALLADEDGRVAAGRAAVAVVQRLGGATGFCLRVIEQVLEDRIRKQEAAGAD